MENNCVYQWLSAYIFTKFGRGRLNSDDGDRRDKKVSLNWGSHACTYAVSVGLYVPEQTFIYVQL